MESVFGIGSDLPGFASGRENKILVAGITRIGNNDLITRIKDRQHREKQSGRRAGGNQDLIGCNADAVFQKIEIADGLSEFQQSQRVRVQGFILGQCVPGCLHNHRRRREIRLPHFHMDDFFALTFQLFGFRHNIHHNERRKFGRSFGNHRYPSFVIGYLYFDCIKISTTFLCREWMLSAARCDEFSTGRTLISI